MGLSWSVITPIPQAKISGVHTEAMLKYDTVWVETFEKGSIQEGEGAYSQGWVEHRYSRQCCDSYHQLDS